MSNWFAGINAAQSGLSAARYGLDIVSQNISNADTDGYTRQISEQAAVDGTPRSGLYVRSMGTLLGGVVVAATARADDPVLDARVRSEHSTGAAVDTTASTLSALEGILPDPGDNGVAQQLTNFWKAWGTVANNPGDSTSRSLLLTSASDVVTGLHDLSTSIAGVAASTSASLTDDVTQANTAATQLADLNGKIAVGAATGQNVNSLLDQRDTLIDTLGKLTGGVATFAPNGSATVTVGGQTLVSGTTAAPLTVSSSHVISVGGTAVTAGGSAGARVTALTTTIPGYQAQLDGVANALASAGNAVEAAGYDLSGAAGTPMFSGSGAAGLTVALTDPTKIAAAGTPGGNLDGSNALAAAQHGSAPNGPDALYTALVGAIGTASSVAQQQQTTQAAVVSNVDSLHASINGVSYDEEVSQMMTYQHAFSASSRVLTTIDQMLDTLINHTGVVGLA